jgi:thiosulfate oxidation carrier complex protein SoxZ
VTQAVLIAKQVPGTPVKLLWSREEDMTHGRYHPIMQAKLTGGLDANGDLLGLHLRLSGQSILASVFPQNLQDGRDNLTFQGLHPSGDFAFGYTIPNLLIDHAMRNTHVPPGFWRGVNINQNAIFIECFMDELAHAAGQDPLDFRRKLMTKHPKHLAVLNAVADRAGWGKPAPQGVYRGLAQMMAFGSYVAACAEISVSAGDKVKVHRMVAATDCGYAVNPAQIERQIAGSFERAAVHLRPPDGRGDRGRPRGRAAHGRRREPHDRLRPRAGHPRLHGEEPAARRGHLPPRPARRAGARGDPHPARRHADRGGDRRAERRLVLVGQRRRRGHAGRVPGGRLAVASALIRVPARARRGEVIEIKTLVSHPMETGYRRTQDGARVPRDIIRQFVCTYNGTEVFRAELHPAIAANPFIAFSTVAVESGTLQFHWTGDNGVSATESATIRVE